MRSKIGHQVIRRVVEIRVLRLVDHQLPGIIPVGILLKGGPHDAQPALKGCHQGFDQLRRAVAHHDILLMDTEVPGSQQGVHPHSRGVLGQQRFKAGLHFRHQLFRREIGVDQIAVIQQLGIPPVAAIAPLHQGKLPLRILLEHGRGNVQILNVIDLVPFLPVQPFCLDVGRIQHGDHAEHLLVILVVAQSGAVRIQEGHIVGRGKILAEFVDVYRFEAALRPGEIKLFP